MRGANLHENDYLLVSLCYMFVDDGKVCIHLPEGLHDGRAVRYVLGEMNTNVNPSTREFGTVIPVPSGRSCPVPAQHS